MTERKRKIHMSQPGKTKALEIILAERRHASLEPSSNLIVPARTPIALALWGRACYPDSGKQGLADITRADCVHDDRERNHDYEFEYDQGLLQDHGKLLWVCLSMIFCFCSLANRKAGNNTTRSQSASIVQFNQSSRLLPHSK